ncbi:MAG: hypothetical protein AAB392_03260 [Patescibacteria group bacterium]
MPEVKILLGKIAVHILNPIIFLGFVVATIVFFKGIIGLIANSDGSDLKKHKDAVLYGIIGLFVMFSVYGILRLVLTTFNIDIPSFFGAA